MKKLLYLLRACAPIAVIQAAHAQQIASAVWDVGSGGNGHRYDLHRVDGGITWEAARDAALAAGGTLATCTTNAENAFVAALVDDLQVWTLAANGRSIGPWIGGFQPPGSVEPAGGWQWLTGEPWTDTNWAMGEPNDSCKSAEEHHLCYWNQAVLTSPQTDSTWNDYAVCVGPVIGYVIEFEPILPICPGDGSLGTACPCNNSGGPGRGCENSASTGGAVLSVSGTTNPDTLVLTSMGERPTSLSIFLQGTTSSASGLVYGDGVRCVTGNLKRLYAHNASSGIVSAPTGTDLPITQRSSNLGDPIATGSFRFYQVYYRDPSPTFCPESSGGSTFNVSSGIRILW